LGVPYKGYKLNDPKPFFFRFVRTLVRTAFKNGILIQSWHYGMAVLQCFLAMPPWRNWQTRQI